MQIRIRFYELIDNFKKQKIFQIYQIFKNNYQKNDLNFLLFMIDINFI